MMDTLLCLIYLHANTFTPICTCLKIELKNNFDIRARIRFYVWEPPGTGYPYVMYGKINVLYFSCSSPSLHSLCRAYRTKSVLPSKPIAMAEDVPRVGSCSTADATKMTTYDPSKPLHSSQYVEDALRNLSLNSRLVEKTRPDVAAGTSHSSLPVYVMCTKTLKSCLSPYRRDPFVLLRPKTDVLYN